MKLSTSLKSVSLRMIFPFRGETILHRISLFLWVLFNLYGMNCRAQFCTQIHGPSPYQMVIEGIRNGSQYTQERRGSDTPVMDYRNFLEGTLILVLSADELYALVTGNFTRPDSFSPYSAIQGPNWNSIESLGYRLKREDIKNIEIPRFEQSPSRGALESQPIQMDALYERGRISAQTDAACVSILKFVKAKIQNLTTTEEIELTKNIFPILWEFFEGSRDVVSEVSDSQKRKTTSLAFIDQMEAEIVSFFERHRKRVVSRRPYKTRTPRSVVMTSVENALGKYRGFFVGFPPSLNALGLGAVMSPHNLKSMIIVPVTGSDFFRLSPLFGAEAVKLNETPRSY